jgi:hypothetical protein
MGEAELKAELINALTLDLPEHTAYVLALLAEALCVEARSHRSPAAEAVATLLALNELQHALSDRLVKVLTYQEAEPAADYVEGLFAKARELGCDREWQLAVRDAVSVLMLWRLRDEAEN